MILELWMKAERMANSQKDSLMAVRIVICDYRVYPAQVSVKRLEEIQRDLDIGTWEIISEACEADLDTPLKVLAKLPMAAGKRVNAFYVAATAAWLLW